MFDIGYPANAVTWAGTGFCAIGGNGRAATSPDGVTWTNRPGLTSTPWGTNYGYALAWSGTKLVAGGAGGAAATSP